MPASFLRGEEMTDWMRGYHAHSGYSYGYQAEIMPARLRWAAMFNKHLLPAKNFRYLDAGCGQGVNLVFAAAIHPDSEFVGIDYMPEHVAHARKLADRCGLDNVTLIEGDFVELAANPRELGEFDMAVCHGIATWIAPEIRQALYRMIGQVLKPGGVFYNGYNCQPGWLTMAPFQQLVKLQSENGGIEAIGAARRTMEQLNKATNVLSSAYPRMAQRLETLESQESSYLVQEYVHNHWQPAFVSDVINELAAVKLNYLGPATLPDIFENVLPAPVRELMRQQPNVALREQVRDFATLQNFRRDLYIKGKPSAWDIELSEALRETRVMVNPMVPRPATGEPYKITGSTHELAGDHATFTAILDRIITHGGETAIGKLVDEERDNKRKATLIETLNMLLQSGWITPHIAEPNPRAAQVSIAIAKEVCLGAPYRQIPVPTTGGAVTLNETDLILTRLVGEGVPREQLGPPLLDTLNKMQRRLAKEGRAVNGPEEEREVLNMLVRDYFAATLPFLKKFGVL